MARGFGEQTQPSAPLQSVQPNLTQSYPNLLLGQNEKGENTILRTLKKCGIKMHKNQIIDQDPGLHVYWPSTQFQSISLSVNLCYSLIEACVYN